MKIKDLKEAIKDIPDDVNITVTSMDDSFDVDFEVKSWEFGESYAELIIPVYDYKVEPAKFNFNFNPEYYPVQLGYLSKYDWGQLQHSLNNPEYNEKVANLLNTESVFDETVQEASLPHSQKYYSYDTEICPKCGNKCKHPYTGNVTEEQMDEDMKSCILVEAVDEVDGHMGYDISCRSCENE